MAKQRVINTKFWNDNWIRKINPLDRYLFLYFLTNEHTNISGIYELPIMTMAFETGIDEKELERSMLLKLEPKVYYIDGWVYIRNFQKHQSTSSDKVQAGIKVEMSKIPKNIKQKIDTISKDIDTLSNPIIYSNTNSNSNSNTNINSNTKYSEASLAGKEINEIIDLFKNINPSYQKFFGNKTQRSAVERLLKKLGREKLEQAISLLPKTNQEKYAPTITTPLQLEDKLAGLIAFVQKEKNNKNTIAIL